MEKTYLQFQIPAEQTQAKSSSAGKHFFENIFIRLLNLVIPKANPDFENKLPEVKV